MISLPRSREQLRAILSSILVEHLQCCKLLDFCCRQSTCWAAHACCSSIAVEIAGILLSTWLDSQLFCGCWWHNSQNVFKENQSRNLLSLKRKASQLFSYFQYFLCHFVSQSQSCCEDDKKRFDTNLAFFFYLLDTISISALPQAHRVFMNQPKMVINWDRNWLFPTF